MGTLPIRCMALAAALLSAVACTDRSAMLAPDRETPHRDAPAAPAAVLQCEGAVRAATLTCTQPAPSVSASGAAVIGGQGLYVNLTSTNVAAAGGIFSFDVSVQNLIPQPLGTTDGTTPDAAGVRVFFHTGPAVTSGAGSMSVLNPDGTGAFTGTDQPYYQWDEVLAENATSSTRPWQLAFDAGVETFEFTVYVSAAVQYPQGWVDVTETLVAEGGTHQLDAVVRSLVGVVLDEPVTWASSNEAAATVDAAGLVTGIAPGWTTITATSGDRTGAASVGVCVSMAVGETHTAVMPDASNLCFSGGAGGTAEYTYMPVNLAAAGALSLGVRGTGIVPVTGPPTPNFAEGAVQLGPYLDAALASEALHAEHLARDRELVQSLRSQGASVALGTHGRAQGNIVPGVPAVGDLMEINVADGCSGARDDRTGRVVTISQHLIILGDTANPAGGFTTAQFDSIGMEFDSIAYPVITANFGAPTDLDGNGRIVAFYTRAMNERTPPGSSAITTGMFASRDLYSSTTCARSNEGEIMYMLVPDPTGSVNGNVRTVASVRGSTVGTLGHEGQHLINASRRLYVHDATDLEEVWLNEGLSHIAEELMFYRMSAGLAPRQNIDLSMLTSGPDASRRVAAFNTYANANYGRLRSFLQRPDTTGPFRANDVLATRGATWAFLRYAADRRNSDDATLWYDLVNTTATGQANLQAALGADPAERVRDFVAAMYADDAVAGAGPEYQVTSWNFRSVYGGLGGFPLLARHLSDGTTLTLSYASSGGTSFLRFGVPGGQFAAVTALSAGAPPASPYSLIVIRTK